MKFSKKLISLLLCAVMVLGFVAAGGEGFSGVLEKISIRAGAETSGIYTYYVYEGEARITGCDENVTGSITVPSTIGGYPVTSIGWGAFSGCTGLTSITIPDSVTEIGGWAFENCTGLESITVDEDNPVYDSRNNCNAIINTERNELIIGCKNTVIPDSVTSIGDYAFYGCTSLTSITIPGSVTSISEEAFYRCTGLTSITIPDSVTSIDDYAFLGCTGLTSITIPDSVTSIGCGAFEDCTGLESITVDEDNPVYDSRNNCNAIIDTEQNELIIGCKISVIPDSVTEIGYCAFYGCTGLTSITIPDSVTEIGYSAFRGCTGLTSITIPDSVTVIDSWAFEDCTGLTSITIGSGVKEISWSAFYNTGYYNDDANWENGVLYIGNYLIDARSNVPENYTVKAGTRYIMDYSFAGCDNLKSITIPDSVTSIDEYAFEDCTGLTSVNIPDSVTYIGWRAFSGCTGLTSITIPDSVTEIGSLAFENCTGLTSITVDEDNPVYDSRNNCNAIINTERNELITGCKNTVIPDSVTEIGYGAFYGCTGLTSITIPDSVTEIGDWAFEDCESLEYVHIPSSVTEIGYNILSGTNAYICSDTKNCYAKTYADENGIEFRVCSGHKECFVFSRINEAFFIIIRFLLQTLSKYIPFLGVFQW